MLDFHGRMRPVVLAGIFIILLSAPAHAQTAARLETLLNKTVVSWSDAAVFILEASDAAADGNQQDLSDPLDAFNFAADKKWLPKNAASGDTARLNGVALLLMRSFDLKGGIVYSIAKSPHHAYRELVYKGIIRGGTDPDMPVSGQQLLLMISKLLSVKEKAEEGV